mgnify:CR=1 FL=1
MRIKKYGLLLICLVCLSLVIVGCSKQSSTTVNSGGNDSGKTAKEKFVLKVGHINAPDHPWNVALEGFAKDVLEATDGNVEIQVFPSSQLGGERDMAEGLKLGTIEMGLFGTGALQSLDKRLIVEELPYAWTVRENAYEALDGELGEALNEILKEHSIIGISYWESGYRHITNSVRPINSLSDLKGLKLRVPEAEMRIDTFKELGALPTPLAFSEVFTALQQRTVDGQENPLATIAASKFYEVQDYLTLSGHIWGSALLAVSESTWNSLPQEYKEIIIEKANIWKEKEREMIRKGEEELIEELKEAGMQVTKPDVEEFKKAVEPIWIKYEDVLGKDLVDIVRKYSNK